MRRRFLIPALLTLVTSASACAAEPVRQDILGEDSVLAAAQGVWRSHESGWILEIDEDGITRWQDTPAACYPSPTDGPTLMGQIEYRYFTAISADTARFQYLPGDGHARFERLDALPAHCTANLDTSPQAVFDVFVSVFERHYAFFDARGVDWPAQVGTARRQLRGDMSEAELFDLLAGMIAPLGDSHTKLIAQIDGERRRAQFGLGDTLPRIDATLGETPWLIGLIQQTVTDVLDEDAQHIANDRIITGTIDDRVGYLQFFTMGGFVTEFEAGTPQWAAAELAALDTIMDEALTQFEGMDAVILDLSNNRGGYDAVCRSIASRFTDAPFLGYAVSVGNEPEPVARYTIEPAEGPRFTGPVYVLTSDVTVSCGEITTMMLRQLEHVTQVGATTRGAFSTPLAKPLPNGWYLELSNERFEDTSGTAHEARGLEPDIAIHPFPEDSPVAGHAAAIAAILADLDPR
ncbi:S41 family peptidase [Maricaulis sp.]|uniref:S41 family peptidase n=1 Tax=Maricaulis sp. TaxID=1486257 RepID=UPI002616F85C|nr:S41 family peptidase [Maricaulis sp.]